MSLGSALFGLGIAAQVALQIVAVQVPEIPPVQPFPVPAPTSPPSADPFGFANIGQLIIFLTTVAGILAQLYRDKLKAKADSDREERLSRELREKEERQVAKEERQRRWDLEDRERARREQMEQTRRAAELVAQKTASTHQQVSQQIQEVGEKLRGEIDANSDISRRAFAEANDVNKKIASIVSLFQGDGGTREAAIHSLETIEATGKSTDEKVSEIKETLEAHVADVNQIKEKLIVDDQQGENAEGGASPSDQK